MTPSACPPPDYVSRNESPALAASTADTVALARALLKSPQWREEDVREARLWGEYIPGGPDAG